MDGGQSAHARFLTFFYNLKKGLVMIKRQGRIKSLRGRSVDADGRKINTEELAVRGKHNGRCKGAFGKRPISARAAAEEN